MTGLEFRPLLALCIAISLTLLSCRSKLEDNSTPTSIGNINGQERNLVNIPIAKFYEESGKFKLLKPPSFYWKFLTESYSPDGNENEPVFFFSDQRGTRIVQEYSRYRKKNINYLSALGINSSGQERFFQLELKAQGETLYLDANMTEALKVYYCECENGVFTFTKEGNPDYCYLEGANINNEREEDRCKQGIQVF